MANHAKGKTYPIQHYVKIMLFISFSALILDFAISFATITIVKQQSSRYLRDTADLYINRINKDFNYINHFMGWTLANDENVETMSALDANDYAFIKANRNLYKRFTELQKFYGEDYHFFLYLDQQNKLLNSAPITMTYPQYQSLKRQIEIYVQDKNLYEKFYSRWSTLNLNGTYYVLNIVPYHNSYMICLIAANELIEPLRQINLGEHGLASLVGEQGEFVTSPSMAHGDDEDNGDADSKPSFLLDILQTRTTVDAEFTNASFHVNLVIQFGAFEKIMIAQLLVVLLAVIIACNLCFILLYFKNKVLGPIKNFSYNLTCWTEDGEPIDMEHSKIIELEKANKQFLHLVRQIKAYKIDIYERELEKQRIALNYMKLQIKPHFFLNCLTTIYSMAQMQMHAEIERMTLSTSRYFRYIFQNEQDFVRLADELEHVRIYLEIQKHRYRDAFVYRIEQDDGAEGARIPPLVLQTFIENAIKYAVSREQEVQIRVQVERSRAEGEACTVIRITDTGPGFSPEVLEKLNEGQPLDQTLGTQIGIMNTVHRLEYLYRKQATVRFGNREGRGASVTLTIPDLPAEPQERSA
ncbi:sensor histidine kinase [Paenibacillus xanthanilyticus]|uniref:Sensor histidine kinase n=1 Tax=Paenibacillus xanthanilyticus TaxID=1783531 RepID=A0ABV8KE07_9BACL